MKKNVLIFGLIAGLIVSVFMAFSAFRCANDPNFTDSMVLGYTAMIVSFSLIFVAIKNFRDRYNNGHISFGRAFRIGLYVTLIAGTMYVAAWLIEYYMFIPDFPDKYAAHILRQAREAGASQPELDKKAADMLSFKEMYKSPLIVILFTYLEILPVGLIISLIAALLLKKGSRRKHEDLTTPPVNRI